MNTNERTRRGRTRIALAASFAVGVLSLTGAGVYAGLNAQATGTQNITSGTLSLTVAAGGGSGGFGQTISNMAPGDVNNVYVDLTNGTASNLAAQNLTLAVSGTGSNLLTTSPTKGLAVAVNQCSVAWVVNPTNNTATCSGTTTPMMTSTAVSVLSATPGSVVSGSITAGTVWHLQVSVTLPSQSETTLNGVLPGSTIQGLSTTLTYTFDEGQRTATTTNS